MVKFQIKVLESRDGGKNWMGRVMGQDGREGLDGGSGWQWWVGGMGGVGRRWSL